MNEPLQFGDGWSADVYEQNGWQVVRLHPPSEMFTETPRLADAIWRTIAHWSLPRMVLDMRDVAFVSSSLMTVLVRIHKRAAISGGSLHVCGLRPLCEEALHACRLHVVLKLYYDVDAAAR